MAYFFTRAFPGGAVAKNLPANAGDTGDASLIPGSGRSPGVGDDNPLQYSCLENSMNRGAWWAIVHRVAKSRMSTHTHTHLQDFFSFLYVQNLITYFFLAWHNIINVFFHFYFYKILFLSIEHLRCIRNCATPCRCLRWASNSKGYFQSRETGDP